MDLTTRIVAVTGASRGIGAAIAGRLAREGFGVLVGYHADRQAADAVVRDVREAGVPTAAHRVDVTDAGSLDAFLDAGAALGTLAGVVANAASVTAVGPLASLDPDEIEEDVRINLVGPILTCRAAASRLRQGGSIVVLGSVAAATGSPGTYVHYAASKSGVATLAVGLAKELGPAGIRVNCVEPGTIWTDFHHDPERPAKVAPTVPLGRAGEPEDIAGAVAWFLSDDSAYATGAVLRVSGGL